MAIGLGNAVGELQERFVEGTLGRVFHHLRCNLRGHALHQHAWRQVAGLHSFLHQGDALPDGCRQRLQALQPVLVILERGERQDLGDAIKGLRPTLVTDRLLVFMECLALDAALQAPFESVVVELVGCRQGLAVDGVQCFQRGTVRSGACGDGRQAEITPAVVETIVAVVGCALRAFTQAALPFIGEQLVQRGVLGTCLGMHGRSNGKHQGCQQQETQHGWLRGSMNRELKPLCYCRRENPRRNFRPGRPVW